MSKITVIGDPHVKNNNLEIIAQLFDTIEELGNTALLTGDIFDTKEVIRGKCLNLVYDRISNSELKFIILVGNHDYFNLECEDHSLKVFKNLNNVLLVDKPTSLYDYVGHNCIAIPYMHDQEKLKDILNEYEPGFTLFGHLDVVSFDYGNGYLSEAGLQLSDLKRFDKVISGHYHKYQQKGNLTYIGTPFSHSFGESNQDKYIGVYDSDSKQLELIKTPFPQHITIEIECDEDEHHIINGLENNYGRIILNGSSENIMKTRLKLELPEGTKIIERPNDEYMNNVSIDETADNLVKFSEWANDIKKLDPDTIKLGTDILERLK